MKQSVVRSIAMSHRRLRKQANCVAETLALFSTGGDADYDRLHDHISVLRDDYAELHEPLIQRVVAKLTRAFGPAQHLFETTISANGMRFRESLGRLRRRLDEIGVGQVVSRKEILAEGERMLHHLRAQVDFERRALLPWSQKRLGRGDWAKIELASGHASEMVA